MTALHDHPGAHLVSRVVETWRNKDWEAVNIGEFYAVSNIYAS